MTDWKKKIKKGDITEACRRAGVSNIVYQQSKKLAPSDFTPGMIRANIELKKIIDERDEFISQYLDEEATLM